MKTAEIIKNFLPQVARNHHFITYTSQLILKIWHLSSWLLPLSLHFSRWPATLSNLLQSPDSFSHFTNLCSIWIQDCMHFHQKDHHQSAQYCLKMFFNSVPVVKLFDHKYNFALRKGDTLYLCRYFFPQVQEHSPLCFVIRLSFKTVLHVTTNYFLPLGKQNNQQVFSKFGLYFIWCFSELMSHLKTYSIQP